MVEAGGATGLLGRAVLVQDQDLLGPVAQRSGVDVVTVHAQAKRGLVPGDRAVELGDGEVHGAERQRGGQLAGCPERRGRR